MTEAEIIQVSDDVSIEKGANGSFIVNAWGSVDVFDKENQRLPVDELLKDAPMMMAHEPRVHLGHTDTEVGKMVDIRLNKKKCKDGVERPGVQVKYSLYGDRRFQKATRKKVEKGELGMLSLKGYAYKKELQENERGVGECLYDLETITFALCKDGMNPEADVIDVNGVSLKKSDDLELVRIPEFNQMVQTYMKDGLSYKQAMDATKETWSDQIHKELLPELEPIQIVKGEEGSGDGNEESTSAEKGSDNMSEELNKKIEELTKALEETKTKVDDLTKERDELKGKLEKAEPKPESLTKEQVSIMVKEQVTAQREEIIKELTSKPDELIKALGFKKDATPENHNPIELMKGAKDEELREFYKTIVKARDVTLNSDIDQIPSMDEIEKSLEVE